MLKAIQPIFNTKDIETTRSIRSWEINQVIQESPKFFEENPHVSDIESMDYRNIGQILSLLREKQDLHLSVNARMNLFFGEQSRATHEQFYQNSDVLNKLTIEIVEHGFCHAGFNGKRRIEEVRENLKQMAMIGVNLSIDDYGAGHNTAGLLLWECWKEAKIDGHIVREAAPGNCRAAKVLRYTTDLFRDLGVKVIFENIESQQMLNMAIEHIADGVQGFFIGRPQLLSLADIKTGDFVQSYRADRENTHLKSEMLA